MRMYDLIYTKKTGGRLSAEQIASWVAGVTAGTVPEEQSAALLMAICWRGMDTPETLALTLAMRDSGLRLDLSRCRASRWTSIPPAGWATRPAWWWRLWPPPRAWWCR